MSIKRQALYFLAPSPFLLTSALALNNRLHASKWPLSTEQSKGRLPLKAHTMRNAGAGVEGCILTKYLLCPSRLHLQLYAPAARINHFLPRPCARTATSCFLCLRFCLNKFAVLQQTGNKRVTAQRARNTSRDGHFTRMSASVCCGLRQ